MRYSYPHQISGKEVCASCNHHSCCVTIQIIHMALLPCPNWIKYTITPAAALLFETSLQFPWWHAYASLKFILNIHASKSQEPNIQRKQKVHEHSQTKAFQRLRHSTKILHCLCQGSVAREKNLQQTASMAAMRNKVADKIGKMVLSFCEIHCEVSKVSLTITISEHLLA